MARKVFHIVPADDGWALKSEGNPSPVATYSTQREAIDEGRKMATDDPDEVDLIIHRTNGTIRERLSFGETAQGSSQPTGSAPTPDRTNRFSPPAEGTQTVIAPNTNRTDNDRDRPQRVGPEDLVSVGTRVSWGAIVAGVVVALAFQVLMGMLALACGLSMSSAVSGETLTLTALITAAVTLFASLFLGGLVATRITAGETQLEAVTYGILVWGAMFLTGSILATTALSNAAYYGDIYRWSGGSGGQDGSQAGRRLDPAVLRGSGLSEEEQNRLRDAYDSAADKAQNPNAKKAAWWSFALTLLSLMTAIGGALVGCGPELVFRRLRERHGRVSLPPPTTPAPAPAVSGPARV